MIESIFFNPWIWIVPILLVLALAVATIGIIRVAQDDTSMWLFGLGFGGLGVLILGGFYFGAMLPPYDASYYQTYRITGEVGQIEAAFNGDEGTMSQVFVARVDGINEFIRSDDQRFRTVDVGDSVNLVCSKQFRYFQEPWYECAFGGMK